MTIKQIRFVDEYVKDFDKTQAAIRAGFSAKTASAAACRLFNDVKIVSLINQRLEVVRATTAIEDNFTHEKIREHFMSIYNRCMQAEPVMRWDNESKSMVPVRDDEGAAVYTFDSAGANRAMENIAKNKGFYEIDNRQKNPIINVAILGNGNNQIETGHTGQLTDSTVLTLLPSSTQQSDHIPD